MKYPSDQFATLVQCLIILSKYIDIEESNIWTLHHTIFSQFYSGTEHNWIYVKDNVIKRKHSIENLDGWTKLINIDKSFEDYPNDCVDDNIGTAMKKAIKLVLKK